jgi:hypothetical protein
VINQDQDGRLTTGHARCGQLNQFQKLQNNKPTGDALSILDKLKKIAEQLDQNKNYEAADLVDTAIQRIAMDEYDDTAGRPIIDPNRLLERDSDMDMDKAHMDLFDELMADFDEDKNTEEVYKEYDDSNGIDEFEPDSVKDADIVISVCVDILDTIMESDDDIDLEFIKESATEALTQLEDPDMRFLSQEITDAQSRKMELLDEYLKNIAHANDLNQMRSIATACLELLGGE